MKNQLISLLNKLEISVIKSDVEFKNMIEIIDELCDKWSNLSEYEKRNIALLMEHDMN